MSRISNTFNKLKEKGRSGLVAYVMAGHPYREATVPAVLALAEAGVDLVELGVPFSDPVADGPTIQAAGQKALEEGVLIADVLDMAAQIRKTEPNLPLLTMTYVNPILSMGYESFCRTATECGVDGVIIPDLPVEESSSFLRHADKVGLDNVALLAPTSIPKRVEKVCSASRGMVYYVSRLGVTGARAALDDNLIKTLEYLRSKITLPFVVGFGISTPQHAQEVGSHANGVVIGSALVKAIDHCRNDDELRTAVHSYIDPIVAALRHSKGALT
jgi:tryptophan synthase alpha chain